VWVSQVRKIIVLISVFNQPTAVNVVASRQVPVSGSWPGHIHVPTPKSPAFGLTWLLVS
jgi:hypothetical protein